MLRELSVRVSGRESGNGSDLFLTGAWYGNRVANWEHRAAASIHLADAGGD